MLAEIEAQKINNCSEEKVKTVGKYYDNNEKPFNYSNVSFDNNKWADASKFLPREFDLCYCKTNDRILSGWHTGISWDGHRIRSTDEILFWKLNYDN